MPGQLVSIRIPAVLLKDSERIAKDEGYASVQEFIRDALRERVRRQKLEQWYARLESLRGASPKRTLTKEEKLKSLEEFERLVDEGRQSEILRMAGLKPPTR